MNNTTNPLYMGYGLHPGEEEEQEPEKMNLIRCSERAKGN